MLQTTNRHLAAIDQNLMPFSSTSADEIRESSFSSLFAAVPVAACEKMPQSLNESVLMWNKASRES
jgi:hypothetical protein